MGVAFTVLAFLLGGYAVLQLAAPFLPALVMGGIVAVLLSRLHRSLALRMPAWLSALLLCLAAYLGLLLPLGFLIWDSLADGIAYFSSFDWANFSASLPLDRLKELPLLNRLPWGSEQLRQQAIELIRQVSSQALSFLGMVLRAIPENIAQLAISFLAAYFFLRDGPRFKAWLQRQMPIKPKESDRLLKSVGQSTYAVVGASGITALLQAVLAMVAFAITGVPRPLFFFVVTFFAALVPVVGAAPVWIGAAIYLYLNAPLWAFVLMLCFGAVISLSDNVVKPLVIGGRAPLHPLVTLLSIFGGLNWIGPVGLFVGPILAAFLVTLMDMWSSSATKDRLIQG